MRARDICDASSEASLYFTAGVHPHEAKSCDGNTISVLRELAGHPRCCAIGECGLDFNRSVAHSATFSPDTTLGKRSNLTPPLLTLGVSPDVTAIGAGILALHRCKSSGLQNRCAY